MTETPREPRCPLCDGVLTVQDNLNGGLITVNVDGHAKAAHRVCPVRSASLGDTETEGATMDDVDMRTVFPQFAYDRGVADERARCIDVVTVLLGVRAYRGAPQDVLDALSAAIRALSSAPPVSASPGVSP